MVELYKPSIKGGRSTISLFIDEVYKYTHNTEIVPLNAYYELCKIVDERSLLYYTKIIKNILDGIFNRDVSTEIKNTEFIKFIVKDKKLSAEFRIFF